MIKDTMRLLYYSTPSFADCDFPLIKEYMEKGMYGGVIHCFSYAKETARQFLDLGYMIGIGGVVTFKNARKVKETVEYVPMDRLLLETDCPYLAPEPHRGTRNSSLNLPLVAAQIATLKGISEEEVTEITFRNAKRFYGID